jgi:hypothetical protein
MLKVPYDRFDVRESRQHGMWMPGHRAGAAREESNHAMDGPE